MVVNAKRGRRGPGWDSGSALAFIDEVIRDVMRMTGLDRLHPRFWLASVFVTALVVGLATQHQEIGRLQQRLDHQSELLRLQSGVATEAVTHLELVRKYGIPYRYLEILAEEVEEHRLDLEFMVALMRVESHYNPNAQSDKAAYGLMQVQFPTALEIEPTLQSFWQLFDPERNIRLGTTYFRNLLDRYKGDYRMAALAYNRGPTRLDSQILAELGLSDSYYRKIRQAGVVN